MGPTAKKQLSNVSVMLSRTKNSIGETVGVRRILAVNFRTFAKVEVELDHFNVLVGANGAGKTNFVKAIRFFEDAATFDIDDAVSLQGGAKFIRNLRSPKVDRTLLALGIDSFDVYSFSGKRLRPPHFYGFHAPYAIHSVALNFSDAEKGFQVDSSKVQAFGHFLRVKATQKSAKSQPVYSEKNLGDGMVTFETRNGRPRFSYRGPKSVVIDKNQVVLETRYELSRASQQERQSIGATYFASAAGTNVFRRIGLYDFSPNALTGSVPLNARAELESNGSNLALVLENLLKNSSKRQELYALLRELLPWVSGVEVEEASREAIQVVVTEKFGKRMTRVPSSLLSHGTVYIAALLVALFFEPVSTVIIEEPERSLHPLLVRRLMNVIADAARRKQVILTTQSPEIVKHTPLEHLLLVSRDEKGFSRIGKPEANKEVQQFMRDEIGVVDLFTQDLLRG